MTRKSSSSNNTRRDKKNGMSLLKKVLVSPLLGTFATSYHKLLIFCVAHKLLNNF